jgi:hypothetical protein
MKKKKKLKFWNLFAIATIFNIKGAQKGEIANFYFIFHPILMGY